MSEQLRRGMVICLTGRMPVERDIMHVAMSAAGIVPNANPSRSDRVVYGDNAKASATAKYVAGASRGILIHVDEFIKLLRSWDPEADDILARYLGD